MCKKITSAGYVTAAWGWGYTKGARLGCSVYAYGKEWVKGEPGDSRTLRGLASQFIGPVS